MSQQQTQAQPKDLPQEQTPQQAPPETLQGQAPEASAQTHPSIAPNGGLDAAAKEQAGQIQNQVDNIPTDSAAMTPTPTDSGGGFSMPKNLDDIKDMAKNLSHQIVEWLTSPAFLAMIGAIVLAWILAPIIARALRKRIAVFQNPPANDAKFAIVKTYIYQARDFLRPLVFIGLLAAFAAALRAIPMFGEDWLVKIAQGLATVFLLYKAIKQFISNPMLQKLALWILIPLALLAVFGYYDDLLAILNNTTLMTMGDTPITLMTLVRLALVGAVGFWAGGISNSKGQNAIRNQEGLDPGVREIAAKLFQILLFVGLFVIILSFAGIPLSGLVVVFSAVALGIGFGLQPIAANFISGLIILFDRTVMVGDYVVLPDGQEGYVEAINMRSTTVETTDGKDIMVPNTKFIEDAYENWTHKDPRQRYEVYFSVTYDTDIDALEDILIPAVSKYPKVLQEPEKPDLELREFGDFGIKFAIEFWVEGIDDGENKFTSDLNFIVWRALRDHGIKMPLPQREVRILGEKAKAISPRRPSKSKA